MSVQISICSDYLAMADCLYITFESISRSKIPAQVDIVVWSRKNLARAMDMTETQFVEWCILIGNDYTAHFKRNLFNEYHEFSMKCGNYDTAVNSPGLVLSRLFIISKGPDYHLSSSNCNLERAITYSRAVYNLSDLSEYDMEIEDSEVKQVAILPEDESCSDTFKLSKEQKKCFDDWMESNDTDLSTGMQVTQFLQENLRKFAKFEELGMSQNVNLFPEILVLHLDVLNVMLKSICTKKSGKESQEPDDRHKKLAGYRTTQLKTALNVRGSNKCIGEYGTAIGKTDIIWRNAVAANTYQLLCKIVIQSEKHRVGNVSGK